MTPEMGAYLAAAFTLLLLAGFLYMLGRNEASALLAGGALFIVIIGLSQGALA